MTNKQTIDGVSRDLLVNIEMTWRQASGFSNKANDIIAAGLGELRALLDKPVCSTGKGEICPGDGVNACKKCPAAQHQGKTVNAEVSAYTPGMGLVEVRLSGGIPSWLELGESVTITPELPQRQGEPVTKTKPVAKLHAERLTGKDGEYGVTVEDSEWFNTCRLTGGIFNLYAEQPTPLTVEAAKAFAKGFNTLESGGGKYRINMQFQSREDAWGAFNVLARLKQLNTPQ